MEKQSKEKVKTGIILALCLVMALAVDYFASITFDLVVLCLSLIATYEVSTLVTKAGYPVIKYASIVSTCLVFVAFLLGYILHLAAFWIMIIILAVLALEYLCFFLLGVWILKNRVEKDTFRKVTNMSITKFAYFKANNTMSASIYPAILLMFLYLLNHIGDIGLKLTSKVSGVPFGLFALILVFAIACLTDTFAMTFGKIIGGVKIFKKISPKKTLSGCLFGFVGGVIGALLTFICFRGICGGVFESISIWKMIIIGLVGAIICEAGDLFESYLKRKAGVKEAGDFFQSHGGVIDRLDSVAFCAPLVFISLILLLA